MHGQARKMPDPSRDPPHELQELLETITRAIAGAVHAVSVCPARGKGFVHFEIRCAPSVLPKLQRHLDSIQTVLYVAGSARRTRVSLQFHEQGVLEAPEPPAENASKILEHLVLTMSRALADLPNDVVVFPADGDGFSHYDVRCDRRDVGALLGSRATHATAMREILGAAGETWNHRASLHIAARDGND